MPKVQPLPAAPCSYSDDHQSQQVYTVWMKSLVFNGNGCTVYTPDGSVAFRVDNYGCRGGREVFLMDRAGKTLIRIRRKGFSMFRRWEVGRCTHDGGEKTTQWFSMRRAEKGGAAVTIHVGVGTCYRVVGWCARKSDYRVISGGAGGTIVAEVVRKQTAAGVVLGEDVLTLKVGPEVDHLLVLGLVVVRGLMNRSL